MATAAAHALVDFLKANGLLIATAESCTAGAIIAALSGVEGGGAVIDSGYVVYSVHAKTRLLAVQPATIARFGLTSEPVAREMALGALRDSEANVAVATTGVAGPDPVDGIPPGTICFAWAFQLRGGARVASCTRRFAGDRAAVCAQATQYAIERLPLRWRQARAGPA